jgi:hypothetical protein
MHNAKTSVHDPVRSASALRLQVILYSPFFVMCGLLLLASSQLARLLDSRAWLRHSAMSIIDAGNHS